MHTVNIVFDTSDKSVTVKADVSGLGDYEVIGVITLNSLPETITDQFKILVANCIKFGRQLS